MHKRVFAIFSFLVFTLSFQSAVGGTETSSQKRVDQRQLQLSQMQNQKLLSNYQENFKKFFTEGDDYLGAQNSKLREELRNYQFLFIDGFFMGIIKEYFDAGRSVLLPIPTQTLVTFSDQENFFRRSRILFTRVKVDPLGTIETNSEIINRAVVNAVTLNPNKKIVFITYSKGSIDLLHSMITHQNEGLQNNIAGWLAINSPFHGTPLIKYVDESPSIGPIWESIMDFFNGDYDVFLSMSKEAREKFLQSYNKEISLFTTNIPTLMVGSYFSAKPFSPFTQNQSLLNILGTLLENRSSSEDGKLNDGFIPLKSSCLSEVKDQCLYLGEMDHAAAIVDIPFFQSLGQKRRVAMTKSLLTMLLKR